MPTRLEMLRTFVEQRPQDPFPRYALALEHKNAGQLDAAWEQFRALIEAHANYTAAYLHAGNTLVALGRREEALAVMNAGIETCRRTGDGHAGSELQSAVAALGS